MAPRILVVEHESTCPPAHVGTWLEQSGAEVVVCRPWAGDEIDQDYDALIVLGGSMGAHDDDTVPWLAPVREEVRRGADQHVPVLGICLGHQLVAVALGGEVARNPQGQQVGVLDVGWLDRSEDELFGGLDGPPGRGIQWNHDIVTDLPDGAVALARTAVGELQVARFADRVWGVQLHPEADEHVVAAWAEGDREEHLEHGIDQVALLSDITAARSELDAAWQPVLARFVELARRRDIT